MTNLIFNLTLLKYLKFLNELSKYRPTNSPKTGKITLNPIKYQETHQEPGKPLFSTEKETQGSSSKIQCFKSLKNPDFTAKTMYTSQNLLIISKELESVKCTQSDLIEYKKLVNILENLRLKKQRLEA